MSDHPTFGYTLPEGTSELVLSLSKIQNFDMITFANRDSVGTVTISTSNSKFAAGEFAMASSRAAKRSPSNVTKIKVGPNRSEVCEVHIQSEQDRSHR